MCFNLRHSSRIFFSQTFEPGRLSLEFFLRNVRAEVLEKKKKSPIAIIPNSSIVDWKREWKGIRVVPGINTMAFICILRRKHERHEKGTEIWKIFTAVTSVVYFLSAISIIQIHRCAKRVIIVTTLGEIPRRINLPSSWHCAGRKLNLFLKNFECKKKLCKSIEWPTFEK